MARDYNRYDPYEHWMKPPDTRGGLLSPSGAMSQRAAAQAAAEEELARLKAVTAANDQLLARKWMAEQEQSSQAARQQVDVASRQQLQDTGNAADLQRLLMQLDSSRALQGDRLSSDAAMQAMRGSQNESLQNLQNRFSSSRDAMQFDRMLQELQAKHRYGQEDTQMQHQFGMERDAAQIGARAQAEEMLSSSDFGRRQQAAELERGYSAKDREMQILETQDSDLAAKIGQLHQMAGNMDQAGQLKYQEVATRLQKIDDEFFRQKRLTRPEYLQARAEVGAQVRMVPWNQFQTSRAGSVRRQGIFDYQLGPDGTWEKVGLSSSATPEEVQAYVKNHMGMAPDGQSMWTVDPIKGTINVIGPRGQGATGQGAARGAGGTPRPAVSMNDFTSMRDSAVEAVRQRKAARMVASGMDVVPEALPVTAWELDQEMQEMMRSYQSLNGVQQPGPVQQQGQSTSVPSGTQQPQQPGPVQQQGQGNVFNSASLNRVLNSAHAAGMDPYEVQGALSFLKQVEAQFGRVTVDQLPNDPQLRAQFTQAMQIAEKAMQAISSSP